MGINQQIQALEKSRKVKDKSAAKIKNSYLLSIVFLYCFIVEELLVHTEMSKGEIVGAK